MAYKFQIGAARLSGSIIQTDGDGDLKATTVDSLNASNGGIAAAGAIAGATTIDASGLASLDGGIDVGGDFTVSAAGAVVAVGINAGGAISGATTVSGSGAFSALSLNLDSVAVTSNAAELNLLDAFTRGSILVGNSSGASALLAKGAAGTVLKGGTDLSYGAVENADIGNSAAIAFSKMEALPAAQIVVGSGANVATKVAMSGDAAISNAGAITLAAAQTNVQTITNAALILSGNAGNKLDMTNAAGAKFFIGGAEKMLISAAGVTVDGDFSVLGTTTTINSTTINISSSFTFEGDVAGDSKTTILHSGLPVANTRVNLPTLAAGTYHLPVLADAPTAASALVTAAEFSLLDGATSATATTVIAADRVIFNDGGLMKQVSMADIKVFTETGASPAENIKDLSGNNDPAEVGVNYFSANLTSTQTVVLPASAGMVEGQRVRIKAPSDCSNTVKVIINRAGSQLMDGNLESISLESPFAAVEFVYVSNNAWRIF